MKKMAYETILFIVLVEKLQCYCFAHKTYERGFKVENSFQSTSKRIFKKIQKHEQRTKRGAHQFDWNNKWLKGYEYAHILKNINIYCKKFNLAKYPNKTHPCSIYTEPQNGMIYFVEGNTVGSEFGFPRVDVKKKYR